MADVPLLIEEMATKDIDEVAQIEMKVFPAPWSKGCFRQVLREKTAHALVARLDGRVVGYIVSWFIADELYIGNIAVIPSMRRRGIGTTLLNVTLREARHRSCQVATLELRESNRAAMELYQKFAFKPVALKRDYYQSPIENAIVMVRNV